MENSLSQTLEVVNFDGYRLGKVDAEIFAILKHYLPRSGGLYLEKENIYTLIIDEDQRVVPTPNTYLYEVERLGFDMRERRYDIKSIQKLRDIFANGKSSKVEIREDRCIYVLSPSMRKKLIHQDFTVEIRHPFL